MPVFSVATVLHTLRSKKGVYTLVYDLERWPEGTRKNRGWVDAPVIYERWLSAEEKADYADVTRFQAWRYRDWQDLVNDEAMYGFNANQLKREYKQFLRGERPYPLRVHEHTPHD